MTEDKGNTCSFLGHASISTIWLLAFITVPTVCFIFYLCITFFDNELVPTF